eukprot:TRINITY_DN10591_c0_g1_i2.p1 TRINITY_DN10591_c0_g1~~TRINITY_DN10591_c0_g1_i2.p1  ORF type:complete len:287 (-),score=26.29 TRINITY_DN10591_c0_g1_i2:11-871(-)
MLGRFLKRKPLIRKIPEAKKHGERSTHSRSKFLYNGYALNNNTHKRKISSSIDAFSLLSTSWRNYHYSNTLLSTGGLHGAKHQLKHRVKEKVTVKVAEKVVHASLPRLVKRVGKTLGPRLLMVKIGRGLAIAVPAIGGLFASIISVVDFKRWKKEKSLDNKTAATAFLIAFIGDIVDVFAHVITALGLSGVLNNFVHDAHHIHDLIHISEVVSVIAAIIATSAAITGEFKSVKISPEVKEVKILKVHFEQDVSPSEERTESPENKEEGWKNRDSTIINTPTKTKTL